MSLRHWGIDALFSDVKAGEDGGDIKIANMKTVAAAWKLPPQAVVAIGDIDLDVHRARAAGLRAVSAGWSERADLARLEAVFRSVGEFWVWLEPQLTDQGSTAFRQAKT